MLFKNLKLEKMLDTYETFNKNNNTYANINTNTNTTIKPN